MVPSWVLLSFLLISFVISKETRFDKVCKTAKKLGFCQDGFCSRNHFNLQCECPPGFTISDDGNQCRDIDECSMQQPCSKLEDCRNTKGSFRCFCKGGYEKDLKGKCQVSDFVFLEAERILNRQSDEGVSSGSGEDDDDELIVSITGGGDQEYSGESENTPYYPLFPETPTSANTVTSTVIEGSTKRENSTDGDFTTEIETTSSTAHCSLLSCSKGSQCVHVNPLSVRCQCPLGRTGFLCEKEITITIPRFLGYSYMKFPKLSESSKSKFKLVLEVKPSANNGLILYSGDSLKGVNDFFAVGLKDGKLQFRFDCGTGVGILESEMMIPLNAWSLITIYRFHQSASLNINNTLSITGKSQGKYSIITFTEDIYLGGLPEYSELSQDVGFSSGFEGYVRTFLVNQDNYPLSYPSSKIIAGFDIDV